MGGLVQQEELPLAVGLLLAVSVAHEATALEGLGLGDALHGGSALLGEQEGANGAGGSVHFLNPVRGLVPPQGARWCIAPPPAQEAAT